jgi:hypothetical protein
MTWGVMLLGVFGVPAALLVAGRKLRLRSARWHRAFWGAVTGHLVALAVGTTMAMIPPEAWAPTDTWRGLLGLWSFALLPLVGALVGSSVGGRTSEGA